jgi:hypothetical protein
MCTVEKLFFLVFASPVLLCWLYLIYEDEMNYRRDLALYKKSIARDADEKNDKRKDNTELREKFEASC